MASWDPKVDRATSAENIGHIQVSWESLDACVSASRCPEVCLEEAVQLSQDICLGALADSAPDLPARNAR